MPQPTDILENKLLQEEPGLLDILLFDHTTQKNIFWATNSYADNGKGYEWHHEITVASITGQHGTLIMPRAMKSRDEQQRRSKQMAEVFTPSWIVDKMNRVVDEEWDNLKKQYTEEEAWQHYVLLSVLEITCGEAPFLTSRYDAVSGEAIPVDKRIGLLDRKLRVVNAHCSDNEWTHWALLALSSVYGYEWQGDNLLLAREALLATFNEFHEQRFGKKVETSLLFKAAKIISWNVWQMDGLKAVVPGSCHEQRNTVSNLFGELAITVTPCPGCEADDILRHNGQHCKIRQWSPSANDVPDYLECTYLDIITKKNITHHKTKWPMKFDFVIGNPPYQESKEDTKDLPLYPYFMDTSFSVANRVELITPARFLFNAGQTSKAWNEKMLNNKHFKILYYQKDSSRIFSNTDIKGGVAITYYDETKEFEPIGVYTTFEELNSILKKVQKRNENSISEIIYIDSSYKINECLLSDFPYCKDYFSSGKFLHTNIFEKLPKLFNTEDLSANHEYFRVFGLEKSTGRTSYWMKKDYVQLPDNHEYWKVFLPKSNGSGEFGEKLSSPFLAGPNDGYTQTFMSIGCFSNKEEAGNLLKYLKSKFARTLLGILKITQHNPISTWKYVPLQDFTSSSDIDWSKSIHEIDLQLYDKYGLNEEERNFIETHVKEME